MWTQGKDPNPTAQYPAEVTALLVDDQGLLFAGIGNLQQFKASQGGLYCQKLASDGRGGFMVQ